MHLYAPVNFPQMKLLAEGSGPWIAIPKDEAAPSSHPEDHSQQTTLARLFTA
jgi:hypothetical protein